MSERNCYIVLDITTREELEQMHLPIIDNPCGSGEIRRYCGGYFSISKADNKKSFESHKKEKQFSFSPPLNKKDPIGSFCTSGPYEFSTHEFNPCKGILTRLEDCKLGL
jgi:rhodanese-related sulfurtransferase